MTLSRAAGLCLSIFIAATLVVSCSSTSNTTQNNNPDTVEPRESRYPDWYNTSGRLQADDKGFTTYATAIDTDSVTAAKKAGDQARAQLQSGVSSRLESVRNDAVIELGSNSGVDSPKFLIALRNAESDIASVAGVEQREVKALDNGTYRAFAEAYIDRESLIEELDKALSANGNAWNNLKNSQAFSKF